MGRINAICTSPAKGTPKTPRDVAVLVAGQGFSGDGHAGDAIRQVSILPQERIDAFALAGAEVKPGDFGENLIISGVDFSILDVGSRIRLGNHALLEISQFGKDCHDRCQIYDKMGDCIMPKYGVFAKVLLGGTLRPGDEAMPELVHRVGIITISDSCSQGKREDLSGQMLVDILTRTTMTTLAARDTVPDDMAAIEAALIRMADVDKVRMILTTGGTGFSSRDVTPEATLKVVDRLVPGLPEAMRMRGLLASERAILSRSVAGLRGGCLIINMPGSPKAVTECWDAIVLSLEHGLNLLAGDTSESYRGVALPAR